VLPAQALPTPRPHWRNRRRVRRSASGRLHQNWNRDYDPLTGKYAESDPIGLGGGVNTYAYDRNDPAALIDPDGLCPFTIDTGIFVGSIWRDKCIRKGSVAYYQGQYQGQFVGTLVGTEGTCDCNHETQTCIYSLVLNSWQRTTPCGGGAFSPWNSTGSGPARTLRVSVDCKTGLADPKGFSIGP
jgi:RHS repeat-associated protein